MDTSSAPRTTEGGAPGGRAATPSWAAIAAWGGGLIQLALGAGAITGVGGGLALQAVGIILTVLGAAALGWGVAALARGRIVVPRVGVGGSLAGILAATAALILDPSRVSVFAVAAGSALLIAVAFACALVLRTATRAVDSPTTDAVRPQIVGLLVGAVLVAGLVTPALAATEAGQHAVPHGEHAEMVDPGHH